MCGGVGEDAEKSQLAILPTAAPASMHATCHNVSLAILTSNNLLFKFLIVPGYSKKTSGERQFKIAFSPLDAVIGWH
jgi:exosortase/archaeosortase